MQRPGQTERSMIMKPYVKPELYYESFELAQHIAGCSMSEIKSGEVLTCTAEGTISSVFGTDHSDAWFVEQNESCKDCAEGYCYTNSLMVSSTINS